jgi:hypothetical protein
VRTGKVLGTVSGVPIVAFMTTIPFYRDLSVGDRGPDVAALERSLVQAGVLNSADDVFDNQTAAALDRIYGNLLRERPQLAGHLLLASSASVPPGSVVEEVNASVGQVVTAGTPLLVLSRNAGRLSCSVPGSVALSIGEHLRTGADGPAVAARVISIGSADATTGQRHVVVQTRESSSTVVSDLIVPIRATAGRVLTVPAGAIWLAPRGGFEVRKIVAGGVQPVPVRIGTTAGGYVSIIGGGISAADRVELNSASGAALAGQAPAAGTTP